MYITFEYLWFLHVVIFFYYRYFHIPQNLKIRKIESPTLKKFKDLKICEFIVYKS